MSAPTQCGNPNCPRNRPAAESGGSAESDFVTGQTIAVDGGSVML